MVRPNWKEILSERIDRLQLEALEFYNSVKFESVKSSVFQIIAYKTDKYLREHGERANIIVLPPEFRKIIGRDISEFRGIPIIYSLNLSSQTNFEKSIQVF